MGHLKQPGQESELFCILKCHKHTHMPKMEGNMAIRSLLHLNSFSWTRMWLWGH